MRSLAREMQVVYISQPLPKKEILDDDGYGTGTFISVYDEPIPLNLNVKPITSQLERQSFGADVNNVLKATYTPFDVDGLEIMEGYIAWIGIEPNGTLTDENIEQPMNNNFEVTSVISTGGQITAYFKKVCGEPKA